MKLWLPVILTIWTCYVQSDACSTPNGEHGQCQRIQDCGLLWDLAIKSKLTKAEVYHLRKSACGFKHATPLVCCPDKWNLKHCKVTAAPPDPRSHCCGTADSDVKLADLSQYPWIGIIEFQREFTGEFRNAILISGRYAISVAQSFTPGFIKRYGQPTIIRFSDCFEVNGGQQCNAGAFRIPVEQYTVHPEYNPSGQQNDIALLKLFEATLYTDSIRPICLPSADFTDLGQKEISLITAGWGPDDDKVNENPIMRHQNAPHLEPAVCAAVSSNITNEKIELGSKQICAIVRKRDQCKIDVGGPLMYYNETGLFAEVAGIASFSLCKGLPNVYTKVYAHREWILENIKT